MDYEYYNPNPKGLHTNDCVVRALSFFFGMSWRGAFLDIINWCADNGVVEFNRRTQYNKYLEKKGYKRQKPPHKNLTVGEFLDYFAEYGKTYIVSMSRHLTIISNRHIYDIGDCSNKKMDGFWVRDGGEENHQI